MLKSSRSNLIYSIFIFLLVIAFFFLYFKPFQKDFPLPSFLTKDFFNKDFADFHFISSQLAKNIFPFWNPYQGGGISFLSIPKNNLFNPFNLLILKTISFSQNLKFLYFLTFLSSIFGTYFYLRLINLYPFVSFCSAISFTFGGVFISQIGNFYNLQPISIIPWIFFQAYRLFKKPSYKNSFLLALLFTLQILSGFPNIAIITSFFVLTQFLFYFFQTKTIDFKKILLFFIGVMLPWFFSAIKIYPLMYLHTPLTNDLSFFYRTSFPTKDLTSLFNPFGNLNFSIYSGLASLVVLISFLFIYLKIRRTHFQFLLYSFFLSLFSILMAIPSRSPFYILYLFPPFNFSGNPWVFLPFFSWFLVLVIALMLNFFLNSKKMKKLGYLLGVAIIFDFALFNLNWLPKKTTNQLINSFEKDYPLIRKLRDEQARYFFVNTSDSKEILPLEANNNLVFKIESLNSISPLSKRLTLFLSLIYDGVEVDKNTHQLSVSLTAQKLLALHSTKYLISSLKVKNLKLITSQSGLNLYEIPNPLPKEHLISKIIFAQTQKELLDNLTLPNFDISNSAVLEKESFTDTLTVYSQSYSPEWQVKVQNSEKSEILPANLIQLAVSSSSDSAASIYYSPHIFKIGALISLISLGIGGLLFLISL